jgi:hypothetical protein
MNSARMYRLMLPVRRPVDRYVWLNEALVKGLSSQDYTSYVRYDSTLLMFQEVIASARLLNSERPGLWLHSGLTGSRSGHGLTCTHRTRTRPTCALLHS